MSENLSGFLDALLENPEDQTTRLVLADWFEERGDARGEFLRNQCRLMQPDCQADEREQLRQRQFELIEKHPEWLAGFPTRCRIDSEGLLEADWKCVEDFERCDPRTPSLVPTFLLLAADRFSLFSRTDTSLEDELKRLAQSRWLARVSRLALGYQALRTEDLQILLDSPHLRPLASLHLPSANLDPNGADLLASSDRLSCLTEMFLGGNRLSDDGAAALAGSPHLTCLAVLDLHNNAIRSSGIQALTASPLGRNLTVLDLSEVYPGAFSVSPNDGVRSLASSPYLTNLVSLNLAGQNVGDEVRALADSPNVYRLRRLDLRRNTIEDRGLWLWRTRDTLRTFSGFGWTTTRSAL
jgi:uncharacterized protein (TIGR02996 family)